MTDDHTHRGDDVHHVGAAEREDNGGWQPIETAPKDGTEFWGEDEGSAQKMLWHSDFEAFVSSWRQMTFAKSYGGGSRNHSPVVHEPTHWMPLPAAPTEGEHLTAPKE